MHHGDQFSVANLIGLIATVAFGLALLRVGVDGGSAFLLTGVAILLAAGGGVVGYIGRGREGVISEAVVGTFVGMLLLPIVATFIALLVFMIQGL